MSSMKIKTNSTFEKIKQLPTALKSLSTFRWECPNCTEAEWKGDPYSASVSVHYVWDEKYHKYKFYMHCRNCSYTTPAFETAKAAFDSYAENLVSAEHNITLEMFEKNQGKE